MLKPINEKIIAQIIKNEDNNKIKKSGIILTNEPENSIQYAKVIAVEDKPEEITNDSSIKEEQKVLIRKDDGIKIKYKDKELIIIDIKDILAIEMEGEQNA